MLMACKYFMQDNVSKKPSVKIHEPVNLYGCELDDDVFIGPFVEIQSDAYVGKRSRIASHSFICSHVSIGEDCFIGHGVMFTNDKIHVRNFDKGTLKTKVGNDVFIGSNATILPVEICSNVTIGAGSVVTNDIVEPGTYAGNPAKKLDI